MNKEGLFLKIDKIFRANTVEKVIEVGQYGETKTVKAIGNIDELKTDIKDLINNQFHFGSIDKKDIFDGSKKLGSSYHISEPINVAKMWGYKYIYFNGHVIELVGKNKIRDTGLGWEDL